MRYAIFSDIHGNLVAWKAALADMEELEADVFVCLGDVVGYGPCPREVLTAIRQRTDNFVIGNHDAAATGLLDASHFNPHARAVIEWTSQQLDPESMEFLRATPLTLETEEILFVHAEITEPARFGYIDGVIEATENFWANQHLVTFVGHTHYPTIFELNTDGGVQQLPDQDCQLDRSKRYIINVGSVGEPRDPDDLRSRYVIYDSDTCEVYFRRVEFDHEAYRRDLAASGLDITPYFITVLDHYEALGDAELEAMTHDMETPLEVSNFYQSAPRQIDLSQVESTGRKPKPKPRPNQPKKVGGLAFILIFTSVAALLGLGWFFLFYEPSQESETVVTTHSPEIQPKAPDPPGPVSRGGADPPPKPAPEPGSPEATLRQGLIAEWKLDDPEGTKWNADSAGNDLDLMPVGAAAGVEKGVSGRAYKLDGKNSQLTTSPNPLIGRRLEKFAISGWFSTTSQGQGREMIVAVQTMFVVEFEKGKLFAKFANGNENRASSPTNLRDGAWRHFVAQNDGKTTQLFVDGELVESRAQEIEPLESLSKIAGRPITIGSASHAAESWFNGFVDEIALWDRPLTEEEILHLYKAGAGAEAPQPVLASVPKLVPDPAPKPKPKPEPAKPDEIVVSSKSSLKKGLLAYWRFDEGAGAKQAKDATGRGADLKSNGAVPNKEGVVGEAIRLTPTAKSNLATANNPFGKPGRMAISGWFKRESKTRSTLISIEGHISARIWDDTLEVYFSGGRAAAVKFGLGAFDPKKKRWRHFVIQNNGSTTALFVDGVSRGSKKQGIGDLNAQDRPLRIGSEWNGESSHFNGWIDEVAIWNRTLNAREIAALRASGDNGRSFLTPPQPLAYWRMDDQSGARALADSLGKRHLGRIEPAAQVAPIAPKTIKQTGQTNVNAQRGGAWGEIEITGDFQLKKNASFTLEGWFVAPPVPELTFLAGTRTGDANDSQGWHIDLRPPAKAGGPGAVGFVFDTGPGGKQVVANNVEIYDGKPHHFAAVWWHDWGAENEGEMRIFVDGRWIAGIKVPYAEIPDKQANRFQIGMPGTAVEIKLDEIRFTPAGLKPSQTLRGPLGSLEILKE